MLGTSLVGKGRRARQARHVRYTNYRLSPICRQSQLPCDFVFVLVLVNQLDIDHGPAIRVGTSALAWQVLQSFLKPSCYFLFRVKPAATATYFNTEWSWRENLLL